MPGGLLPLVAYGNMNRIISGNPQMTYFYKAFLRYSHFSQENITVPLDGQTDLNQTAPIKLRAKIPRHGDLLSDMYLTVNLPAIYNKRYPNRPSHEFAWVRQVGLRMIDTVGLYIGGTKVQEYTSDWLAVKYQLDLPLDGYEKWSNMIGDVPELFAPASGAYSDPSGGYPNVVPFPGITTQTNSPSIPARELNIPLGFFFSDSPGLALPLIGLQYHDVEVQITLRPLEELYTVTDKNGIRVRPGYMLETVQGTNIYYNSWPQSLGPLPEMLNNNYVATQDNLATIRNFLTDIGYTTPIQDILPIKPRLQCTYIYLTEEERKIFGSKKLEYLVRQVQTFTFDNIIGRQQLQVDAHSLVTRFIWIARRSDWFYKNDYTNLTNWKYTLPYNRPFLRAPNTLGPTSGLLIPGTEKDILLSARIICGGTEIFEEKTAKYFSEIMPFRTSPGNGYPYLLNGVMMPNSLYPIYMYSLAMNSASSTQPSGTINTSKISKIDLEVNTQPLPPDANYSYNFLVFAESLNFLEIASGMGGMKYSI